VWYSWKGFSFLGKVIMVQTSLWDEHHRMLGELYLEFVGTSDELDRAESELYEEFLDRESLDNLQHSRGMDLLNQSHKPHESSFDRHIHHNHSNPWWARRRAYRLRKWRR